MSVSYNEIYNNLINNGYHIGKFDELFNSFTETNEEEFLEWTKFFRETAEKKDLQIGRAHV